MQKPTQFYPRWKYLLNCFLLLIPIFLWNIVFAHALPNGYDSSFFWKDIPMVIAYSENILRIVVFGFPLIMVLSLKTRMQRIGGGIFLIGLVLYFMSWILQIYYPKSVWSESGAGFMAPAYTTIIFFIGVGLIGNKSFFPIRHLSIIYISLSILFVIIHTMHTYIVFLN